MIRKHAAAIRDAFAQFEMRMVERDCLIIYEGDVERVNRGLHSLKRVWKRRTQVPNLVQRAGWNSSTKVIAGEGPDEGVLSGMDTTLKLLDGGNIS